MILPHLSASARVNVTSSSGLDLAVSTAMSSIRFFTSGRNRIRPISALSLETISFDKPAGPLSFPKIPSLRFAHERAAEVLAKVLAGDQADEAETLNTFKELLRLRQVAEECAKDAAPYIHPRLSAVRHSGPDGEGPVTLLTLLQEIDGTTRGPPNAAKTI